MSNENSNYYSATHLLVALIVSLVLNVLLLVKLF